MAPPVGAPTRVSATAAAEVGGCWAGVAAGAAGAGCSTGTPSSAMRFCTLGSSQALASGSVRAMSSRMSNSSSSPRMSYSCSVALVASGPTVSSWLMRADNRCFASAVSGRAQVPSETESAQPSNSVISFMPVSISLKRASTGRASSIL